jgi:hypothetical protein
MEVEKRDQYVLSVGELKQFVHTIGERWKLRNGISVYIIGTNHRTYIHILYQIV